MSDIFTEVDEDLRRERAAQLWKKYGNWIVAAAVLIVGGTAAGVYWKDYHRKQAELAGAQYVAALEQARTGEAGNAAMALANVARETSSGYSALARLEDAALKSRNGDTVAAAATYRAVAADSGADRSLRDAAQLLAALTVANTAEPAEINAQLAGLAQPGNPWRHLAWEIQALAAARAGKMEEARTLYAKIADDPDAPTGLRARAAEMLQALEG